MDNNIIKRKVLIVDDEEAIRNLLRLTLEDEGFDVQVALNGRDAIEKLRVEYFEVLLTDIKMPIMDGIELLKAARVLNPEIAAILITGFPSIDTVREAHRSLAFDYIVKPFDPNTVLNCINAALTRRTVAQDLEKSVHKPKILVVDDEPLITNLFEASLREEGYLTEIADNGKKAMERFLYGDFNIVITDINMPEMDGRSLLDNLKSVKPDVIVIVITGYPSVDSAIESMRLGAYDYITKPIDPDTVINVIKRAWDKQSLELQKADLLKRLQEANLRLTEANESLKELDQLKSHFISTVSHELRTPITSIKGSIGLILNNTIGSVDDDTKELLNICYKNTDRLIRLINNLLDIQKIEAGRFELNRENTDIRRLVEECATALKPFAMEFNVSLCSELPDNKIIAFADKDRISQVIYNLISNGVKFSKGGRVVITVGNTGQEVHVMVSDTGPGIPHDKFDEIFGRFNLVKTVSDTTVKGTGLGLSICKAIIEEHRGKIWVESLPGKGSVFHFTLPKDHEEKRISNIEQGM